MTNLRCTADHHAEPPLNIRPVESGDHPRPFFNRLKNLSRSPRPLKSGPDQSPLYFWPTYALPDQGPLIADLSIFQEWERAGVDRVSGVNGPLNAFRVFLDMVSQCMCFTRFSASVTTSFAFFLVWRNNACVSHASLHRLRCLSRYPRNDVKVHFFISVDASVKTPIAFSSIWRHNACVLHAYLHRFRRLLRFLSVASQYKCFTCVFASVKTPFVVSPIWCQNACISYASLHRLRRPLPFLQYGVTMHLFHTRACMG